MTKRPRIGMPMRIELETDRFYLGRHYSEAVEAAGGAPLHISLIPDVDYIDSVVEGLDGILLPGSDSDIDPLRYGQQPHPKLGSVYPLKDETDLLVIAAAEAKHLPILGICFGQQVLNVSRGGTLIQDISSQVPNAIKHEQGVPRDRQSHKVTFEGKSRLSQLSDVGEVLVNSHHHQAVDRIGRDLIVTARSTDGLIEAIEDPREDRWVVAVQWHPEVGWENDFFSQEIFKLFIKATCNRLEKLDETSTSISTSINA